jgi:RNA polymerase sigma-70 factor (ECF subfamily)
MTDSELREQLERWHPTAFGWAVACCKGHREEAEDVLQDAYLAVLRGNAQFAEQSSFRTWLFGVIRLTAASAQRKSWLHRLLLEKNHNHLMPAPARVADADLDERTRIETLRARLSRLSERQQQVLHLVFYQEMTIEEAAVVMGISTGSARTHYTRGKERLAHMLGNGSNL